LVQVLLEFSLFNQNEGCIVEGLQALVRRSKDVEKTRRSALIDGWGGAQQKEYRRKRKEKEKEEMHT